LLVLLPDFGEFRADSLITGRVSEVLTLTSVVWCGKNMELARKGRKILLVDDEPDIAMAFKLALQDAGYIVDTSLDPIIALSKFKSSSYDLVILDIKMPKLNGFELYAEMRKADNKVKVCFITAGEMFYDKVRNKKEEDAEQYCKLDTQRFIQKPISNIDLVRSINRIIIPKEYPDILQKT
jgi:two-component system, OmpR family, response regulator ChvI